MKLRYFTEALDKMQHYVEKYKKFQNYLERVVNETGEFQSITEIFNRYETLVEARQALSDHQDRNLQLLESKGSEIVIFSFGFTRNSHANIPSTNFIFNCLTIFL